MRSRSCAAAAAVMAVVAVPAQAALQSSPPSIADIIEIVEISSLSAAPDGRHVAFRTEQARLESNTHRLTWHVADLVSGESRAVGNGGAPLYRDPGVVPPEMPVWTPDSMAILYRARVGDEIGIWRASRAGSEATLLFRDPSDVEALRAEGAGARLVLGPRRDAILAAERDEYLEGVLVDAGVALNQNLVRSGYVDGRLATQRLRGQWFTRVGLLSDVPRRERTIDLETFEIGAETAAAPPTPLPQLGVDPGISARSPDGAEVRAVWSEGVTRMEAAAHAGRPAKRCTAQICRSRIVALAWRPGRDELLFTVQDRQLSQSLYSWSPRSGAVRRVATSDGILAGDKDGRAPCALTRAAAICIAAAATSPPRLERIDLDTGARSILFDPNEALRRAAMPGVERLAWQTPEGDSFTGILLLPRDGPRQGLPLFINYYHCSGFLSGSVGDEFPFLPLAGAGMAVACLNLPPPTAIEDNVGRYEQGLRAVRSLVAMLGARGTIDPGRVGMAGLSFGSEVTMWTLVHSDLLAAAAIASSQMEPTYYWFNSVRGRSQPEVLRRFWQIGAPDETPEAWQRQSASRNVDRIRAPLLMQLPEQEARNVIELYSRLTRSTRPAELYAFPDAAHLKVQPRQRFAAHRRYYDWFRFWLQDRVDPDPNKAAQYRRWSELRARWRSAGSAPPGTQP